MLIPHSHRGLDFKVAAKPTARKRVSGFHRPLLRRRRGQKERPGQANHDTEEEGEELDMAAGKGQVHSTSSSSPASEMSLLQELNSAPGSASSATATMLGTMEQDWALDSLDGFARMRMEQQDARKASHYAASTSAPTTGKGHTNSISGGKGFATGHPRTVYPSAMPVGVHAGAESGSHSGRRRPVVELDPLYARRNPHVLEALRLMKRVVHIRGDGSGTLDEVEESWSGADDSDEDADRQQGEDGAGSDMDWEEEEEELRGMPEEALEHEQAGPAAPSPSSSWAQSLEAAGFVLRQSTAQDGTTYLERVPAGLPSSTGPAAQPSNKLTPTSAARQPQKRSPIAAPVASVSAPPAVLAAAAASLVPRKDTRPKLKQALRKMGTPEQVLDLAAALYPTWASCGCRLAAPELLMAMMHTYKRASQEAAAEEAARKAKGNQKSVTRGSSADIGSGKAAALVPTPAEAAQVLQGVAVAMRRAGWSRARCLQLCSDSRLVGLVEALRVVPPRLAAEQQQQEQLSRAFFRSARTYWLDHGGGGAGESGARQADLDGGAAVSASRDSRGTASGSSRDGKGGSDDVYRQTLAKFLNQQQQPELDTGSAVSSHANEVEALIKEKRLSVTHKAFVSAVWALAVIGGPTLYSTEVEALLQIAKAGGSSWRFYEGEGANLAWALAASRHWSSRLADLEEGLVQSGGIPSLMPSDAVRVLWAFATLGGPPPQKLLSSIHPDWQWHVPQRNASSASPGAARAGGSARAGRGSKSSSPRMSIGSGEGDLVGWDPMRDHPVPKQPLLAGVLGGGTHQQSGSASQNAAVEDDASAHSSNSTSVGGHDTNSSGAAHSPPSSSKGIFDSGASLQGAVLRVPKGGKAAAAAGPPAPGGLSSFTTSQLAGCCWALAVMPGGVDSHAFQTAWAHLLQRLAGVDAGPQQGHAGQQQRRMPVISSDAAAHVMAGCSDAVLSQIWQAAMAVRLDSKWACASQQQQQQQQQQHQPQAGLPSTAATITAATSILTSRPPANNQLSLGEGHASSSSLSPSSKAPQDPIAEQGPGSPDTELLLSGAEHALLCAHEAFLRCSRALRGVGGHSSYQRAMANCLTSMRMMHVLEDSSSGYSVDISLPHLKLAIEADGPSHFSRTPGPPKPAAASSQSSAPGPPVVSGPTAMKRRHLKALGWAVVSIPFTVWDRLGSDAARQQFMQQRITQAVADRVPIGVQAPQ